MRECCKKYTGNNIAIKSEEVIPVYCPECGLFLDRFRVCPHSKNTFCGDGDKDCSVCCKNPGRKVYCEGCLYFCDDPYDPVWKSCGSGSLEFWERVGVCHHEKNKCSNWRSDKAHKRTPSEINANNDCPWWEAK